MKTVLVIMLSLGALGWAQDQKPEQTKRLKTVTWDLNTHKLVWVVETGRKVDGEFVADSTAKYEVSPDDAQMIFADQKRSFGEDEAASLHHLLDVLSLYCAESVVWWDQGEGVPASLEAAPRQPGKTTSEPKTSAPDGNKPVKVDQQQPGKKKAYHPSPTDEIALNRR